MSTSLDKIREFTAKIKAMSDKELVALFEAHKVSDQVANSYAFLEKLLLEEIEKEGGEK